MSSSEDKNERKYVLHQQRLKSKYQLLHSRWRTTAVAVSLAEIALVLGCSPRYTRLLLNSMMDLNWLTWAGRVGRGAKGRLHCRVKNIASLNGDIGPPITLAPHVRVDQQTDLAKTDNRNRIFVKFYRSIDKIIPSDHSGRVERHLLQMVHSGLTRFDDSVDGTVSDLAESMQAIDNNHTWIFTIRKSLVWHNSEPATVRQILRALEVHLLKPAFKHVVSATCHGDNIVIKLSRPDAMLDYRLANPVHVLSHPDGDEIGLGAFRIVKHDDRLLQLETFTDYYGETPAIQGVEFRIEPGLPKIKWTTRTLFLADEEEQDATQLYESQYDSGFIFLAFNEMRGGLTYNQKKFIRELAKIAVRITSQLENTRPVASHFQVMDEIPDMFEEKLPASLTLKYFWCPETEILMGHLKRQMFYWGCNLTLLPVDANLWFLPARWCECDIGVSDLRFGERWYISPSERFSHSVMMKNLMPVATWNRLEKLGCYLDKNRENFRRNIIRIIRVLIRADVFTPLMSLRFNVKATDRIKGVHVLAQGWADYKKIWIE